VISISSLAALHRLLAVTLLGFASGLPLALTGQAMQAWLTADGIDLATIGFLSLVGLPYTFKFLWAPLMDRFDLPSWRWPARCWRCRWRLRRTASASLRCWP
jgi:PAT family beta-lactamase induction signal transducer AmpG